MISEDTVQQLYSGSFSVKITEILHVCCLIPKYNHMLFQTCNADKPAMNVWCPRKHWNSYHNRGVLWNCYGKLTSNIQAHDKNCIKMMQKLPLHFSRKAFLKFPPVIAEKIIDHRSIMFNPLLNLRNQHPEEMRWEVHCLLCLIFSESILHPLVSKKCWKARWDKGCNSNHWRQYFTINVFKLMITDPLKQFSGSPKTSLNSLVSADMRKCSNCCFFSGGQQSNLQCME